jgi:UDP-N-acetyl-2-amino-2-deoxyglucuronate dehydrogenase
LHPAIIELRNRIANGPADKVYKVKLHYFTSRGHWYHTSWKGDVHKSGGIATNIGVHFFDMLQWVFGNVESNTVALHTADTATGTLKLAKAQVDWYLSINYDNMPQAAKDSYEEILNGNGFPLIETKTAIEIVHDIRKDNQ